MSRKNNKINISRSLGITLAFAIIVIAALLGYLKSLTDPVAKGGVKPVQFIVPKGSGAGFIAQKLKDEGLIRSTLGFKYIVYKEGLVNDIQAGLFLISPSQTTKEIAHSLTKGTLDSWTTLPEGLRNEQIAEILEKDLAIDPQAFIALSQDLQGRLFPDTYLVPNGADAQKVIDILLANYTKKTSPLAKAISSSDFTEEEILTLASIIERETLTESEKPIVAGILIKRINSDWPLQVDATLQYIKGNDIDWWPTPLVKDKELNSPYNTYQNLGLPPKPIANPGLSSIEAVLEPKSSNYWYYIHDSSGQIHFAETVEQHNANINKYLR